MNENISFWMSIMLAIGFIMLCVFISWFIHRNDNKTNKL